MSKLKGIFGPTAFERCNSGLLYIKSVEIAVVLV
jgi:hypothetical protein